jgi:hypothetical protein
MGPLLALIVLVVGRTLPESPRWLMTHGRVEEGYLLGAGIMAIGGVIEIVVGINAEGKSLETVTKPLTSVTTAADEAALVTVPPTVHA